MPFSIRLSSLLAVCLALSSTVFGQSDPGYRVVQKATIGGDGGWDYLVVDPAARRLYVTRATRVMVFDADTLKAVGEIPNTNGVHGVALAPELSRGFASNGRAGSITIFDTKTLAPIEEVKIEGQNPDAILYDPPTKRVFAFNGRSGDATVLDAASGKVVGTIPLGGKPEFATTDLEGHVFVNLEDKSEILALDPHKLSVEHRWPLAPCEEPSGMAIDRAHKRLFVGCGNKTMAMVDAATGKVLATAPIGNGVDANGFDPGTGLAFSSNGEGTLTVAKENPPGTLDVLANVPTQRGARTMAVDEKTHRVFLVTSEFGPPPSPTADQPHPRPSQVPGTFTILVVGR
ncbi:MAG TPA: YncE family protein [Thermoanaerobaculia bacterium]|jgi:YVTN family beta-propeller protein